MDPEGSIITSPQGSTTSPKTTNQSPPHDDESKNKRKVPTGNIFPCVLSIGYNPFYKNTVRSVEVHVMHTFTHDFYDSRMNLMILGYIRPEYDYAGVEALIEDIRTDIEVARRSLAREGYQGYQDHEYLLTFGGLGHEGETAG